MIKYSLHELQLDEKASLKRIFRCTDGYAKYFSLTARTSAENFERGVLQFIQNSSLIKLQSLEWPGTKTLCPEDPATVFIFDYNENSKSELLNLGSQLWDWVSPSFPEDLAILRFDLSEILTTISVDKDGYLTLLPNEVENFRDICDVNTTTYLDKKSDGFGSLTKYVELLSRRT